MEQSRVAGRPLTVAEAHSALHHKKSYDSVWQALNREAGLFEKTPEKKWVLRSAPVPSTSKGESSAQVTLKKMLGEVIIGAGRPLTRQEMHRALEGRGRKTSVGALGGTLYRNSDYFHRTGDKWSVGPSNGVREKAAGVCTHHWMLPEPDGPTTIGVCKKCGATQEGGNSMEAVSALTGDPVHPFRQSVVRP